MKTELDTPMTNAEEWTASCGEDDRTVVWSDFARILERKNFALASQLAECAGYLASVNTARTIEHNEETWALQTLDWANGAAEIAARANAVLDEFDNSTLGESK